MSTYLSSSRSTEMSAILICWGGEGALEVEGVAILVKIVNLNVDRRRGALTSDTESSMSGQCLEWSFNRRPVHWTFRELPHLRQLRKQLTRSLMNSKPPIKVVWRTASVTENWQWWLRWIEAWEMMGNSLLTAFVWPCYHSYLNTVNLLIVFHIHFMLKPKIIYLFELAEYNWVKTVLF